MTISSPNKLTKKQILAIANQSTLLSNLDDEQLSQFCIYANQTYRAGKPVISDEDYDFIYLAALKKRNPAHPLLTQVEPEEQAFSSQKYRLPKPMLSTDKAYTWTEVENWLNRITKSATQINLTLHNIQIQATPKLDGFAAFDDGKVLYTRGDGKSGSDISRVFKRGLSVFNEQNRGLGAGEIVVQKSYFKKYLSKHFDFPRNFQASIIKEKELDNFTKKAINDKAALFVPFVSLPKWQGSIDDFRNNFDTIVEQCFTAVDFNIDGVVLAVTNPKIQQTMGSTRKFHRWQLAFKENKAKAQVKVLEITPQVGRTGKITPVVELEPTLLSGATLRRASAHHYGFVKEQNLGTNSVVELTRSGLVIPKINKVLKATKAQIPTNCPSCNTKLVWQRDFLTCPNQKNCKQQHVLSILFFFSTLDNNNGFGLATIEKLYANSIQTLRAIYQLNHKQLTSLGFGDKISTNLLAELEKSKTNLIEDWRLLAAFGISRLGLGNSEKLLQHYPLANIFNLSKEQIGNTPGFADITASGVVDGLSKIKTIFAELIAITGGFNLEITPLLKKQSTTKFNNLTIIFSGKMHADRQKMQKRAKQLGFKVLTSVSKKCNYLVVGEKVGQSKLSKARKYGIKIVTEADYLEMIK